MQQENNTQRFQNICPRFGCLYIDVRIFCNRAEIKHLRGPCRHSGDKSVELQRVDVARELAHVALNISGNVRRIVDFTVRVQAADNTRHTAFPQFLENIRR